MSYQHQPRGILPPGTSKKRKDRDPLYPIGSSHKLLAGYMAFEYLTAGTLFGQKFDPGSAEAVPLIAAGRAEPKRVTPAVKKSYCEVANILKAEGAYIPGIVNPTQLARWIQM